MPIFDFKCTRCGHVEEVIANSKLKSFPCPKCKGQTEKQIGAANIVERTNLRIPASKQRKRII